MTRLSVAVMIFAAVVRATPAQASALTLSETDVNQLFSWLGQAPGSLTSIFSKEVGDGKDSYTFHTAVDGEGPTFVVFKARDKAPFLNPDYVPEYQLFGGYNPQSWESRPADDIAHITTPDSERTGFIFNLTTGAKQDQKKGMEGDGANGRFQTSNNALMGPIFGLWDIHVDGNLETAGAYLYHHAYGPEGVGDNYGCIYGECYGTYLEIAGFEVYTISPAEETLSVGAVPEPASLLLMGTGILGLVAYRRRKAARPATTS